MFYKCSQSLSMRYLIAGIILLYLLGYVVSKSRNKGIFVFSFSLLLIVLAYYKYGQFFVSHFEDSLPLSIDSVIAPLGISFMTFEAISYLADIQMKKAECGNLLDVALFILFFPKVVSGPIVLWRDFSKQSIVFPDAHRSEKALTRIIIGFGKKVLLADVLGRTVSSVWANILLGIDAPTAWLAALYYMMQIYFDFSGYSDIAIGLSTLFGYDFAENFNQPYLSTSIREFWRRWHISLGTWFREYVYIPLGGNRKHVYLNLLVVFILTGVWHGSTLNFVVWGALYGIMMIIERRYAVLLDKWNPLLRRYIVLLITFFMWILFTSPSFSLFSAYINAMFSFEKLSLNFTWPYYFDRRTITVLIVSVLLVATDINKIKEFFNRQFAEYNLAYTAVIKVLLIVLFGLSILFVVNSSYSPFLYFQF